MRDFLNVDALTNQDVHTLIKQALLYKKGKRSFKSKSSVVNMFFENSTRTKHSFEMAQHKLGMHTINFDATTSSVHKGESLYDSVLTMQALGVDIAIVRHGDDNYYKELESLDISIINGGAGSDSHPSQSLLDLMTIYQQFGTFKDLKVQFIGDILHSRVAMSNMKLLYRLGARLYFSGPREWWDDEYLKVGTRIDIDRGLEVADVVMLHRIQLERHDREFDITQEEYHQAFGLTQERYELLNDKSIIMHPAPVNRDMEIASHLVESDKSKIVEQMENGVYMRMAILETIEKGRRK